MKFFFLLLVSFVVKTTFAQDTIRLSKIDAEAMFLENNLSLLAQNLQIERRKAQVIQSRTWPNPVFSIGEINAWATDRQTGGSLVSPPFWNNVGRNQQIAFELEQLIQTAGKRKKLIAVEELDVSKSEAYFQELLRGLKYELRCLLTEMQYLQRIRQAHQSRLASIGQLTEAYAKQLEAGHIPQGEFVRLRALELEIRKAALDNETQLSGVEKQIKLLLHLLPTSHLELNDEGFECRLEPYTLLEQAQLVDIAKASRPDYKLVLIEEERTHGILALERAQRVPDLTFQMNYDRNGNTMLDFVGFGVSFDLPVFNRNRGNIKKAELAIERAELISQEAEFNIENEVGLALANLQRHIAFAQQLEPGYEETLDGLLDSYTANFSERRISLLEYVDFLQAYLENKSLILDTHRIINQKIEELQYSLGTDLLGVTP